MRHLSDERIQEYLDSKRTIDKFEIERHLAGCFECQGKLESYLEVYSELSTDTIPITGYALNQKVLARIEELEYKKVDKKLTYVVTALSAAFLSIIALSLLGYFTWQGVLESAVTTSGKFLAPVFESVALVAEKLNGNLVLLGFAALAILLFQLLDFKLVRQKTERL